MSEVIKSLLNLDDAGAGLVSAKLTAVYEGLLQSLAVMPSATKLFPVLGSGQLGHVAVESGEYEQIGKAKIVNNNATDIPAADIGKINRTAPLAQIANYFRFSTMELETAARTGAPLDQGKQYAALLAQAAEIDRIFFQGDAQYGITGLTGFNFANVALKNDGTGNSTQWEAKGAAEIARDMRAVARAIALRTNGTRSANTLVLSGDAHEIAATKNINGKTALAIFAETMPGVSVVESVALKTLGGKDILAMDKSPATAGIWLPMFGHLHPEQRDGLALKTIVESRTAGLIVVDSRAIVSATGLVA
jgi:hypothetical protein